MKPWGFIFGSGSESESVFAQYGTADSDSDPDAERLGYCSIFGTGLTIVLDSAIFFFAFADVSAGGSVDCGFRISIRLDGARTGRLSIPDEPETARDRCYLG
jgi:hypothetical protein